MDSINQCRVQIYQEKGGKLLKEVSFEDLCSFQSLCFQKLIDNRKVFNIFQAAAVPVRTNNKKNLCKDLFLPTTLNQALRVKNIVGKIFAIIGSLFLDIPLFPIRLILLAKRVSQNKKAGVHDLSKYLQENGVKEKCEHVFVKIEWSYMTDKKSQSFSFQLIDVPDYKGSLTSSSGGAQGSIKKSQDLPEADKKSRHRVLQGMFSEEIEKNHPELKKEMSLSQRVNKLTPALKRIYMEMKYLDAMLLLETKKKAFEDKQKAFCQHLEEQEKALFDEVTKQKEMTGEKAENLSDDLKKEFQGLQESYIEWKRAENFDLLGRCRTNVEFLVDEAFQKCVIKREKVDVNALEKDLEKKRKTHMEAMQEAEKLRKELADAKNMNVPMS